MAALVAITVIAGGLGLGAWQAGVPLRVPAATDFVHLANRLAIRAGFGIEQIDVTGYAKTDVADVFLALAIDEPTSIIGYDLAAARGRLEALNWVGSAALTRVLPDRLSVRIQERQPFAIWQSRQLLFVIDRDGRSLDPVGPNDYPLLPVVTGDGAATLAPALFEAIARYPDIRSRLTKALRVGGRRWTLKLRSGPDVLLPAGAPDEAPVIAASLAQLDAMIRDDHVLDRSVLQIDLRLADRVTVQLPAALAAQVRKDARRQTANLVAPPVPASQAPPVVDTLITEGL